MRITEGMRYYNLLDDIAQAQERAMKAQEQASSGKRIQRPDEDPLATSDILRLNSEGSEADQYSRNLTFAKSKLQATDAVLDNIEQMVERARTLGQLGFGNSQLAPGYVTELNALRDQLITAANTTYGGRYIFGGTVTTTAPYVKNPDSSVTYNGNDQNMPVEINRGLSVDTQIPGTDLFSSSTDIFQVMSDLTTAMQAGDKPGIDAALKQIEQFTDIMSVARTKVGGYVNLTARVESDLSAGKLARSTELSHEEAADLAAAISELTLSQNGLQATLAVGARISQLSLLDYL
jgi:flagellar hook-associated protein 3 FlgL